jgi:ADP-heptose:LPS heptosyltransferase
MVAARLLGDAGFGPRLADQPIISLSTSLSELACLAARASLVMAGDGPLLQLAVAARRPLLALFPDDLSASQRRPLGPAARRSTVRLLPPGAPLPVKDLLAEAMSLVTD